MRIRITPAKWRKPVTVKDGQQVVNKKLVLLNDVMRRMTRCKDVVVARGAGLGYHVITVIAEDQREAQGACGGINKAMESVFPTESWRIIFQQKCPLEIKSGM